jgi:outer membrane receptor protein involved in Fe transport
MGYLAASRGFQSGGWNLQTPQNPAFGPETLDDFEAGLKVRRPLGARQRGRERVLLRLRDLQISALTPIGQATTNAAAAELYGLELQLDARLARTTEATLGVQATRGPFPALPQRDLHQLRHRRGGALRADHLRRDREPASFAPELKFNLGGTHAVSLGSSGFAAAEREPGLQFGATSPSPTTSCGRDRLRRSMPRPNGARSGAARRSGCGCST